MPGDEVPGVLDPGAPLDERLGKVSHSADPREARSQDRGFEKAEWALIPIFSGSNIVAVLTGVRRTPVRKLVLLLSIGIAGRLALMWWLARFFDDELESFLRFTTRYQWWVLGLSIGTVVLVNLRNLRRR